ncbi:MAG TPA: FecR domain-containing protein [Roseiarcus sp.]|nr:FecR domain-containing protein [Roseiarcus sp.]
MRNASHHRLGHLVVATLLIAAQVGPAKAESVVGTAGAANTRSTGAAGGNVRVIEIGEQIVANEKIETSTTGSVQLLFIDKTTLNIGPGSSVVIDKFVFNPVTTQGELAVTLGKGALRLVGGQATHTGGATIATPVAAIGVRGGIVTVTHGQKDGTKAFLGYGKLSMTSRCGGNVAATVSGAGCTPQTVFVTRPGFMVQTTGAGAAPSQPVKASAASITQTNIQLTSKAGQTGGSSAAPTDQQAAGYNVGTANSAAAPAVTVSLAQARGSAAAATTSLAQATQQSAQQGQQSTAATTTANIITPSPPPPQPAPPTPPKPPPTPAYPATAFVLTTNVDSKNLGQSQFPYLVASFVSSGANSISTPFYGYRGASAAGTTPNAPRAFQANFAVNGQGANQTSMISVMTASGENDPVNGRTFIGNFFGTSVADANPNDFNSWTRGFATSTPQSIALDSNLLPTGSFTTTQNSFKSSTATVTNGYANPPTQSFAYVLPANAQYNYLTNQTITRAATPAGLGADHPTETLQGYVGGLFGTYEYAPKGNQYNFVAGSPMYAVTNASGTPGDVSVSLMNGSRLEAVFNVAAITQSFPANNPNFGANSLKVAQYRFGNPQTLPNGASASGDNGAYVDSRTFAALSERQFNASSPSTYTSSVNGTTYNDPAIPGGTAGYLYSLMIVSDAVGANSQSFLSSISSTTVSPCVCDYTRWGFWSVQGARNDPVNNNDYYDQTHLAFWVAGLPAKTVDIPSTGTATYTGHAIAEINNGTRQYIAAGAFSNAVNFGTATGAVSITGLDNTNYSGTVGLIPHTALFTGGLLGDAGNRAAVVNGSFFQGGPTNSTPLYGEMGGSINLFGPNYLGSGIFAARKP